MSKARTLANLISDNAELADGQISVAEVVGAAPTANPTFTGTVNADAITMSGFLTVNGGADFNTVLYPDGIAMADSRTISFGTSADFEVNGGSTFLDFNLKDDARHLRIKNGLVEHHRFSGDGSVIFNESGADANFRVESDNSEYMLYVDGGTNSVGIKTNATDAALNVNSQSNSIDGIRIVGSGGNNFITGYGNQGNLSFAIREGEADDAAEITLFRSGSAQHKLFADSGTSVVFNEQGDDIDFRVESDNRTNALFVDASADAVKFDATVLHDSDNGNQQFIITRQGSSDQAGRMYVDDAAFIFNSTQDEATGASFVFRSSNGTVTNQNLLELVPNAEAIFNQDSADIDFRVESNNNTHALFVDAGTDRIGVGTSNPLAVLDIQGNTNAYSTMSKIYLTDVSGHANSRNWSIGNGGSDYGNFTIGVSNAAGGDPQASGTHFNPFLITKEGNVVFNEESKDADFRVESDTNTHAIFVDGNNNSVAVGTNNTEGATTNFMPLVAGRFATKWGTALNLAANTWVTIYTFEANAGNFIVSARGSGTGNVEDNTTGIAHIQTGPSSKYTDLLLGNRCDLRMSGANLQVYQSIFTGANISWSVMRICN